MKKTSALLAASLSSILSMAALSPSVYAKGASIKADVQITYVYEEETGSSVVVGSQSVSRTEKIEESQLSIPAGYQIKDQQSLLSLSSDSLNVQVVKKETVSVTLTDSKTKKDIAVLEVKPSEQTTKSNGKTTTESVVLASDIEFPKGVTPDSDKTAYTYDGKTMTLSVACTNSNEVTTLKASFQDAQGKSVQKEQTFTQQVYADNTVDFTVGKTYTLPEGYAFVSAKIETDDGQEESTQSTLAVPYGKTETAVITVREIQPEELNVLLEDENGQALGSKQTFRQTVQDKALFDLETLVVLPDGYTLKAGQNTQVEVQEGSNETVSLKLEKIQTETDSSQSGTSQSTSKPSSAQQTQAETTTVNFEWTFQGQVVKTTQVTSQEIPADGSDTIQVDLPDLSNVPAGYSVAEADGTYSVPYGQTSTITIDLEKSGETKDETESTILTTTVVYTWMADGQSLGTVTEEYTLADDNGNVMVSIPTESIPSGYELAKDQPASIDVAYGQTSDVQVQLSAMESESGKEEEDQSAEATFNISYVNAKGDTVGTSVVVMEGEKGQSATLTASELKIPSGYELDGDFVNQGTEYGSSLDVKVAVKTKVEEDSIADDTTTTSIAKLKVNYYITTDGKQVIVDTQEFESSEKGTVGETYTFTLDKTFTISAPKGYELSAENKIQQVPVKYGYQGTISVQVKKTSPSTAAQTATYVIAGLLVISGLGLVYFGWKSRKNKEAK